MAKIPITNIPEVRISSLGSQSRDNRTIPMRTGGPILPENRVRPASSGPSMGDVAMSILDFVKERKNAKDALNAGEVELIEQQERDNAYLQMRENPNDYEKFPEFRQEAEQRIQERAAPFLSKISGDRRLQMEQRMRGRAQDFYTRAELIRNQAETSNIYNGFKVQIQGKARQGDVSGAMETLSKAQGLQTKVFSDAEAQGLTMEIQRLGDYGAAEREIQAGSLDIAERLRESDDKGTPKNYKNLTIDDRRSLERYANHVRAQREIRQDDEFYDGLLKGNIPAEEQLEARQASGEITLHQKNQYIKMARDVQAGIVRAETKAQKENASALKAEKEDSGNRLEIEIMEFPFSSDPAERTVQYDRFNKKIKSEFVQHPSIAKRLLTQLSEKDKAAAKPDTSYKESFPYKYAMGRLESMKPEIGSAVPGMLWGTKVSTDKKNLVENHELFKLKIDSFIRANPKATQGDIDTFMDQTKQIINKTEVDKRLSTWGNPSIYRNDLKAGLKKVQQKPEKKILRTGTIEGRRVIQYSDGSTEYTD